MTLPLLRGCRPGVPCSWAKPTWTSLVWDHSTLHPSTARPSTPTIAPQLWVSPCAVRRCAYLVAVANSRPIDPCRMARPASAAEALVEARLLLLRAVLLPRLDRTQVSWRVCVCHARAYEYVVYVGGRCMCFEYRIHSQAQTVIVPKTYLLNISRPLTPRLVFSQGVL